MTGDCQKRRAPMHISRRELLRWGALMSSGLLLHGCGAPPAATPVPTQKPPASTATPPPAPTPVPPTSLPPVPSEGATVALVRTGSVRDAVQRAVEMAGGLDFIQPGDTVLVKPNVNSPDAYPATTNPEIVEAVVWLVFQRDPKRVIVADRSGPNRWGSGFGDTIAYMKEVGIYDAAIEAGAEVTSFDSGPWMHVQPAGAANWDGGFSVPQAVMEVDHIISLPVVKTHFIAGFTMSLKNWVGLLNPDYRIRPLHDGRTGEQTFGHLIAELNLVAAPSLVVMDGTRAFVSGGPASGDAVEPGLVIASRDRVANDAVGLALLKTLGTTERIQTPSVWAQPQIARAVELGIGVKGADEILLKAEGVPEIEEIRRHLTA